MITELQIEGFKSFGSPGETIELGPLNFIVGANASGKTNLLHALRFLQNAVNHDVSYAVSELGGSAEVRNKHLGQQHTPKPVRLAIKVEKEVKLSDPDDLPNGRDEDIVLRSWEYELALDLGSNETAPSIVAETLSTEVVATGPDKHGNTETGQQEDHHLRSDGTAASYWISRANAHHPHP